MKTFVVGLMIAAAAAGFGWTRRNHVIELQKQNAELRENIGELHRYKAEEIETGAIDTNELKRLRAEWLDLARMRSEIGQLREAAKVELPKIQAEVESIFAQAAEIQERGPDLLAQRAAKLHSSLTREYLQYSLLQPLIATAKANGGRFPSSFAEMERMSKAVPKEWVTHALSWTNQLNPQEVEIIGRSFSVSARSFEFVASGNSLTTTAPPALILREIAPRQLPDGRSARFYGFTDGKVEESISADGNFADWEGKQSLQPKE